MRMRTLEQRRVAWLRRALAALRVMLREDEIVITGRCVVGLGALGGHDGEFYGATPMFPAHILVNRELEESVRVLCVLLHELAHFATEDETRAHGAQWRFVAKAFGLRRAKGEPTHFATPTPTLRRRLEAILARLGPYPKSDVQGM